MIRACGSPSECTDRSIPRERATAENLSAQTSAMVSRSTGSSAGFAGSESNLASQSRLSTMPRSRWLSRPTRRSAFWYWPASRRALRASPVSASITDSGVRSSWEASAVNSSWRRRACSTGPDAFSPITRVPRNTAPSRTGAATTSAVSSTRWMCSMFARLWAATSQTSPALRAFSRKVPVPNCAVCGRPDRDQADAASGGAPGLAPSARPAAVILQSRIGGDPTSLSSPSGSTAASNPTPCCASPSVSLSWESTCATSLLAAITLNMARAAT